MNIEATRLWQRLNSLQRNAKYGPNAKLYTGAVENLIERLPGLLERISNTFPHYTSHAVDHSITIADRIGLCLPQKTLRALSATEIYIMIAGSLLHDVGMVVSERDYNEIEARDTFKALKDERRFRPFFDAADDAMEKGELWVAAFNRRYLIGEFIRRTHAIRSAEFVLELPEELAAAKCNDTHVVEAIVKVCQAHGFSDRLQLENEDEFPRSCLIRDDEVDLAFCAVLLRLGDLLDLGHERACPLVRQITEPLPGDSTAH